MNLVKPSFEIIEQGVGSFGLAKHIEKAARTCYKSEHLITNDSAIRMVERLVESKHYAMLEHATVYLKANREVDLCDSVGDMVWSSLDKYIDNPYSKVETKDECIFVTTNMRVIIENGWQEDFIHMCKPTDYHHKRVTVKFITDQGVLREFTRHRVFSFAVESTRYCNYGKDKFGNQLTFILPPWADEKLIQSYGEYHTHARSKTPESIFIACLNNAEKEYLELLEMGWKPERARNVLPLATKCEIVMTGFASDWKHFFALRAHGTTGTPHPQASELAIPLMNEFIKREII